jgi:hypothetical protein
MRRQILQWKQVYDLPFEVNRHRERALIVGAGTGNDVQAALRAGYGEVVSVDIDPRILELGVELHPERPYDDPRVRRVNDDARAFFEQYRGPDFDVVCFGLLDSHAMFSSMSSLRLDNYVYTEQGIRAAWRHVADTGHLSLSFSVFAGSWIADRLYWTITRATGTEPIALDTGVNYSATFLVPGPAARLDPAVLERYRHLVPEAPLDAVRTTSDDWPFLYLRPGAFPWGYVVVLAVVLAAAAVATPLAFGRRVFGSRFDPALFLMGAGFLLLETRGVTSLSLVFGSTWVVNSAIFAGILSVVLLGSLLVARLKLRDPRPWFLLLLLSCLFLGLFDVAWLQAFSLPVRGTLGTFLNAFPIACAGVVVPILLLRSAHPTAALGSNLLGSVLGGCLEYLSMYVGLAALAYLACLLYLGAFLLGLRRLRGTAPAPA